MSIMIELKKHKLKLSELDTSTHYMKKKKQAREYKQDQNNVRIKKLRSAGQGTRCTRMCIKIVLLLDPLIHFILVYKLYLQLFVDECVCM